MNEVINKIKQWHYDRNLIEGSTDLDQFGKLQEEVLELHEALICNSYLDNYTPEITDAIGDIMVVLINIAERNGLTLEQCLEHAYNDIKDRTGRMVDGVFVKDQ
jgi:NTP pyrophosphatase (non-canonical NTP hydrolase)